VKITDAERKTVSWGVTRRTPCPYCGAEPHDECVRTAKDGYRYKVWDFHVARLDAAILSRMFIIPEELELADVV
jgi:hypothetical protein